MSSEPGRGTQVMLRLELPVPQPLVQEVAPASATATATVMVMATVMATATATGTVNRSCRRTQPWFPSMVNGRPFEQFMTLRGKPRNVFA